MISVEITTSANKKVSHFPLCYFSVSQHLTGSLNQCLPHVLCYISALYHQVCAVSHVVQDDGNCRPDSYVSITPCHLNSFKP